MVWLQAWCVFSHRLHHAGIDLSVSITHTTMGRIIKKGMWIFPRPYSFITKQGYARLYHINKPPYVYGSFIHHPRLIDLPYTEHIHAVRFILVPLPRSETEISLIFLKYSKILFSEQKRTKINIIWESGNSQIIFRFIGEKCIPVCFNT